ncbi:hypothetical protein HanXRQr2_Chr12g0559611 [Helianthus annuus]|uniref:Uncharacterized protein n=1 Tax=Helianthus annuus TaxID=4232 RepID=A0A9K3MXK6_HELAN|nr:hypothetical protein HanXRQr2_Chr12g0559611 [Helianthus annuus]
MKPISLQSYQSPRSIHLFRQPYPYQNSTHFFQSYHHFAQQLHLTVTLLYPNQTRYSQLVTLTLAPRYYSKRNIHLQKH